MPQAYEPPEATLKHAIFISHGARLPDLQQAYEAGQLYALVAKDFPVSRAIAACVAAQQAAICFGVSKELNIFVIRERPESLDPKTALAVRARASGKAAIHITPFGPNWKTAIAYALEAHF